MSLPSQDMYDVVYCVGPKDRDIVKLSIETTKKQVGCYRNIYILSREPLGISGTIDISEEKFPFTLKDVNHFIQVPSRCGWYLQQLLKLYVWVVIPDLLSDYVVIDSDTLFLKPITFVKRILESDPSSKRWLLNCTRQEYHIPYFDHMRRVHPEFVKQVQESGICHHMIFNREVVKEMMAKVETLHQKEFWKVFLSSVDEPNRALSGASEYEMYFNYLIKYHAGKIAIRALPFSTVEGPLNEIPTNRTEAYINNHWWCRPKGSYDQVEAKEVEEIERLSKITLSEMSSLHLGVPAAEIISGERLQCLCDLTIITKEIRNFHSSLPDSTNLFFIDHFVTESEVKEQIGEQVKSIFVYTHLLDDFITKVWPYVDHPVVLMTHNSDHIVDEKYLRLLNDEKLIHMFSQNAMVSHPKLTALPIGLANSMWPHGDTNAISDLSLHPVVPFHRRQPLIVANFRVGTYPQHRTKVMQDLHQSLPTSGKMSASRYVSTNLIPCLSYQEIQKFKLCACPRGNGPDTHRLWESLYLGVVPIVDDIVNTQLFKNLPMIRVKSDAESNGWKGLDEEWVRSQLSEIEQQLSTYQWDQLRLSWWKAQLERKVGKSSAALQEPQGSFVISYLGRLPAYLVTCLKQIRVWNPTSKIYVAYTSENPVNSSTIASIRNQTELSSVEFVPISSLSRTMSHHVFDNKYTNTSMNFFWKYAMERFFITEEVMRKYDLKDVFHLEVDNMVYFDFESKLNVFRLSSNSRAILSPSDNETRYIAGVVYIPSVEPLTVMNMFFAEHSHNQAEMEVMMQFSRRYPDLLKTLPVVMPDYPYPLNPKEGIPVQNGARLYEGADLFDGLFDAAALGQFMGGIDKIHNPGNTDGFINPHCAYRIDVMETRWITHENKKMLQIRLKPSLDQPQQKWWNVYNLHIHSKDLHRFVSW